MRISDHPKIIFRVPPEVKEWIKSRAASNERTMNWEIVKILKAAMREEGDGNGTH